MQLEDIRQAEQKKMISVIEVIMLLIDLKGKIITVKIKEMQI